MHDVFTKFIDDCSTEMIDDCSTEMIDGKLIGAAWTNRHAQCIHLDHTQFCFQNFEIQCRLYGTQ